MVHSNLDISQCQECCLACSEGLLASDPGWPKLRAWGYSCQAVTESGTPRETSRFPKLPHRAAKMDCLGDRWMNPFRGESHNDYCFISAQVWRIKQKVPREVITSLWCKMPYLHSCLLESHSEFFIIQLPTEANRLQCCPLSSILSWKNPSHAWFKLRHDIILELQIKTAPGLLLPQCSCLLSQWIWQCFGSAYFIDFLLLFKSQLQRRPKSRPTWWEKL